MATNPRRPRPALTDIGSTEHPSLLLLTHVADLLANIREGLEKNQDKVAPAVSNQRLVDTAKALLADIQNNPAMNPPAHSQYGSGVAKSSVKSTRDFVSLVASTLSSLQTSTKEGVTRSVQLLEALEEKALSLAETILVTKIVTKLDVDA